jgi:hypothetical protein
MKFDFNIIHKATYPMPEEILDSLRRNKLIFFIGAGVSRIIGCKGWEDLAANLLNECMIRKYITHLEYEGLKQQKDSKKIITIVYYIFDEHGETSEFIKILKKSFECDIKLKTEFDIYSLLNKFEALYLTTNADRHFDTYFAPNNLIHTFSRDTQINKGKLYHIHGMEERQGTLVLTVDQYLDRYNSEEFISFLNNIFENYTVVFIGYGLDEYEVMDHLFKSARSKNNNDLKHFFIKAYYSHEIYLLKADHLYFNKMGVNVIGYRKDENGFAELYNLLQDWEKENRLSTPLLADRCDEIEKNITLAKTYDQIDELMKLVETRPSYWKHFLKILSKNIICIPKFIPYLINNSYFNIDNNPPMSTDEDNPGHLSIPYWDILDFLLLTKDYLQQNPEHSIYTQLRNVFLPLINESTHIDNYHTDRVLIEIIFSFPEEYIDDSFIDFIRITLNLNIKRLSVSGSIYENVLPACKSYKDNKKILKILDIVFDSRKIDNISYIEYRALLDNHFLSECIKNYLDLFFEKIGYELIDLILYKLKKISDTLVPLFGIDKIAKNYINEQLDSSNYDKLITLSLFHLLNKQDISKERYIKIIKNDNSPLFKKIVILFETASTLDSPQNDYFLNQVQTGSESPVTVDELLQMDAGKLQELMKRPLPMYGWNTPSKQGLIEVIHSMISRNPDKITEQSNKYILVPILYKYAFLSGVLDNARNKKQMNWSDIFNFTEKIINQTSLWEMKNNEKILSDYNDFILSAIADLVYYYNENYIILKELYNIQKKLILTILSKVSTFKIKNEYHDISSLTLNSTVGKSYLALIKLASFNAKEKENSIIRWDPEIYNKFFPELFTTNAALQLCYVYGTFLPTFMYLDNEKFFDNLGEVLSKNTDEQLNAFFTGYLYNVSQLNKELHLWFKENGIYKKILSIEQINEYCYEKIAVFANIAYFNDIDNIEEDNSLIRMYLDFNKQNCIKYISDFVWRQKKNLRCKYDCKTIKLWKKVIDYLSNNSIAKKNKNNDIYSGLLSFLSAISLLDSDVIECVKFSIEFISENDLFGPVLEDLIELYNERDENKKAVCEIMNLFINKDILFLYQDKKVISLVKLILKDDKQCASRICMAYKNRGHDFLMDTYKKNIQQDH